VFDIIIGIVQQELTHDKGHTRHEVVRSVTSRAAYLFLSKTEISFPGETWDKAVRCGRKTCQVWGKNVSYKLLSVSSY